MHVILGAEEVSQLFGTTFKGSQLEAVVTDLGIETAETDSWIAGGVVVRHLLKTDIFRGDIDIFSTTSEQLERTKRKFAEKNLLESKHALSFDYSIGLRKTKVQIIEKLPKEALFGAYIADVLREFDLQHCKFAICGTNVASTTAALVSLAQKKIRLANINNAPYSLGRVLKYKRDLGFDADEAIDYLGGLIASGKTEHNYDYFDDFVKARGGTVMASSIGKS